MKRSSLFQRFFLVILCLSFGASQPLSQRPGSTVPRQEKLLNGLRLLMWNDPAATDVKVSIRIHSGSSFDPQGKEGVMKLLADNIFPTPASREFFTEDLGGSLEVVSNYDYIQLNATGRGSEYLTVLQTLAQAISNPTIDKDTTTALKMTLAAKLVGLEKDPAYIGEQAAAKRLFGSFPYGRPQMGSTQSIKGIDFADLISARDRFLRADNATVAITGNFNSDTVFRAARRYFGAWSKSDRRVPSTFRQPDAPDTKPVEISVSGAATQSNFALRGLARNDPDYLASVVLESILRERSAKAAGGATVSHEARVLPGVVMVHVSGSGQFPFSIFGDRISEAEFTRARGDAIAALGKRPLMEQWLDAHTYGTAVGDEANGLSRLTIADVQRAADRLAKNPIVSVVVKPTAPAQ
ncbi:MAG TPA: insulinase family protein [Pyrinomonadaceae bacterium]|nr:insulinase family protein [Pyrinomonadaceae bacterium]